MMTSGHVILVLPSNGAFLQRVSSVHRSSYIEATDRSYGGCSRQPSTYMGMG